MPAHHLQLQHRLQRKGRKIQARPLQIIVINGYLLLPLLRRPRQHQHQEVVRSRQMERRKQLKVLNWVVAVIAALIISITWMIIFENNG